ncbi:succinate--CoA ligase subunit beta [Candidatus Riesia pediculicola]|uniref:succinate--CoA ligase subunit beta n=1 Tax=Candidatus Riesia pediculicola TaxID=401619 RepID=UPI0009B78B64|nr:ATP-grasp domain-containing protein [Candidatus Riesia pediculicola]ARC53743.1 hypothetical protein AOE55_01050 [Candidatus Riesia pediculicola]
MYLYEYQVKRMLFLSGFLVPKGFFCQTIEEVRNAIFQLNQKIFVLKCQIQSGGRKKSGAIEIVSNIKEAELFFFKWMNKKLITNQTNSGGQLVIGILVEEHVSIKKETYASISLDKNDKQIMLIFSSSGGTEVEKYHRNCKKLFRKIEIDPIKKLTLNILEKHVDNLGYQKKEGKFFSKFLIKLLNMFFYLDLLFVEINPIAIDKKGRFFCLDGKSNMDCNAFFRKKELKKNILKFNSKIDNEKFKLYEPSNYVLLKGNIGCIANGAGLAMATMDLIKIYGGNPANFLDIGGNTDLSGMKSYIHKVLVQKNVNVILINIFGGIVRCEIVAEALIQSLKDIQNECFPKILIRLSGNGYQSGINYIEKSGFNNIFVMDNLEKMVKRSVHLAKNVYFNK